MIVEELEPASYAEWDHYVDQHPMSTCYHLRAWKTVAERAYRLRAPFLIARENKGGPCQGVLPSYLIQGFLQSHMTNGLFGAYGSVLANSREARLALVDHAIQLSKKKNVHFFMLKTLEEPSFEENLNLAKLDSWVIATLALQPDPQMMWKSLRDKIRNCVRKAERSDLKVRFGDDQLPHFYEVLAQNMHSKGAPIYGIRFMRELVEALPGRTDIITLWKDNQVISGAFLIYHRKTVYVPFASSRPEFLAMSPNNLLYWEIIKRGCERKMDILDFGRSLKDSGPLKFKLGWGAQTQSQPSYVFSPRGKTLNLNPDDDRLVSFFVRQWKRMPRKITDSVGPSICRQLAGLI